MQNFHIIPFSLLFFVICFSIAESRKMNHRRHGHRNAPINVGDKMLDGVKESQKFMKHQLNNEHKNRGWKHGRRTSSSSEEFRRSSSRSSSYSSSTEYRRKHRGRAGRQKLMDKSARQMAKHAEKFATFITKKGCEDSPVVRKFLEYYKKASEGLKARGEPPGPNGDEIEYSWLNELANRMQTCDKPCAQTISAPPAPIKAQEPIPVPQPVEAPLKPQTVQLEPEPQIDQDQQSQIVQKVVAKPVSQVILEPASPVKPAAPEISVSEPEVIIPGPEVGPQLLKIPQQGRSMEKPKIPEAANTNATDPSKVVKSFQLSVRSSGKCISNDVANTGGIATLTTCSKEAGQNFVFETPPGAEEGQFQIKVDANGRCLGRPGRVRKATQQACENSPKHLYTMVKAEKNEDEFQLKHVESGYCLAPDGGESKDGTPIMLSPCNNGLGLACKSTCDHFYWKKQLGDVA